MLLTPERASWAVVYKFFDIVLGQLYEFSGMVSCSVGVLALDRRLTASSREPKSSAVAVQAGADLLPTVIFGVTDRAFSLRQGCCGLVKRNGICLTGGIIVAQQIQTFTRKFTFKSQSLASQCDLLCTQEYTPTKAVIQMLHSLWGTNLHGAFV